MMRNEHNETVAQEEDLAFYEFMQNVLLVACTLGRQIQKMVDDELIVIQCSDVEYNRMVGNWAIDFIRDHGDVLNTQPDNFSDIALEYTAMRLLTETVVDGSFKQ